MPSAVKRRQPKNNPRQKGKQDHTTQSYRQVTDNMTQDLSLLTTRNGAISSPRKMTLISSSTSLTQLEGRQ